MSRKLFRKMVTPVAVSMMLAQASGYVRAALPDTFKLVNDFKEYNSDRYLYPLTRFCAESGNADLEACKSPSDCLAKIKEMLGLGENDKLAYGWMHIGQPDGTGRYHCVLSEYNAQQNILATRVAARSRANAGAYLYVELPPDVLAAVKDQLVAEADFYNPGASESKKKYLQDLKYYERLNLAKSISLYTLAGGTGVGVVGLGAKAISDANDNPTPKSMVENWADNDDASTDAEDDDDD